MTKYLIKRIITYTRMDESVGKEVLFHGKGMTFNEDTVVRGEGYVKEYTMTKSTALKKIKICESYETNRTDGIRAEYTLYPVEMN